MNNVASFNTLAQCIVRLCCCWLLRQCPLSSYWLLLGVWRDVMCCCGLILLATIIKAKDRNPLSRLCKSKMLHTFLVLPKVSSSVRVFFFSNKLRKKRGKNDDLWRRIIISRKAEVLSAWSCCCCCCLLLYGCQIIDHEPRPFPPPPPPLGYSFSSSPCVLCLVSKN